MPDYVIYSTFGKEHLKYDCIKIFYTGEEQSPDFNVCDYAMGFDYITFGDRYFRLPLMYQPLYRDSYIEMVSRGSHNQEIRNKFCSFVYSNSQADPIRNNFFEKLSEYKKVDSGGRFKNNIGRSVKDKLNFERGYKFSIAFENVSHPGYYTEKIVQAFAAGGIPIYWGDPLIEKVFNPNAFINIMNFKNMDNAIDYVRYLDNNDEEYLKILGENPLNTGQELEILEEKFEKFVRNIFDQDLNYAKRTTRVFWNKKYLTALKNQEKLYSMFLPVRKLRYVLLKSIRKS